MGEEAYGCEPCFDERVLGEGDARVGAGEGALNTSVFECFNSSPENPTSPWTGSYTAANVSARFRLRGGELGGVVGVLDPEG